MQTEESDCRGIELVVEGSAIEVWGIGAQRRHCLREFGRARGDKGEMGGISCDPIVGAYRKKWHQRINCVWRHAVAAERRAPQEERDRDAGQPLATEKALEDWWICQDGCFDAGIVNGRRDWH